MGNALRYTPSGGTVTVAATPAAHHVRIQVIDTGPGVPQHLREGACPRR